MTNVLEIGVEQLRGVWAERQGLAEPLAGGVSGVVGRCGWMNSAGSSVPYVALRARIPGCTRSDVDLEVFESESIVEVFAVRACTMLLLRKDLPANLSFGVPGNDQRICMVGGHQSRRGAKRHDSSPPRAGEGAGIERNGLVF